MSERVLWESAVSEKKRTPVRTNGVRRNERKRERIFASIERGLIIGDVQKVKSINTAGFTRVSMNQLDSCSYIRGLTLMSGLVGMLLALEQRGGEVLLFLRPILDHKRVTQPYDSPGSEGEAKCYQPRNSACIRS